MIRWVPPADPGVSCTRATAGALRAAANPKESAKTTAYRAFCSRAAFLSRPCLAKLMAPSSWRKPSARSVLSTEWVSSHFCHLTFSASAAFSATVVDPSAAATSPVTFFLSVVNWLSSPFSSSRREDPAVISLDLLVVVSLQKQANSSYTTASCLPCASSCVCSCSKRVMTLSTGVTAMEVTTEEKVMATRILIEIWVLKIGLSKGFFGDAEL
mmetsp:Transcript_25731/g.56720  ORF Transcript_25731/g.56720 Transcript_25731/m.56720 type:complete len:213 (+) Transcript_25731:1587-2225(+)